MNESLFKKYIYIDKSIHDKLIHTAVNKKIYKYIINIRKGI